MGTFSIWHWLIVLVGFVIVPVTTITLAKKEKSLARLPYLYRIIGLLAAGLVIRFVGEQTDNPGAAIPMVFVALCVWILQYLWMVHRTQDIGWSKWWVLLTTIPLVNLVYGLVILFVPGRRADVAAP